MVLDLVHNVALLVALAVGLQTISRRLNGRRLIFNLAAGLLFGAVGVAGMMTPMQFVPGIIYDGRSIVLGLAGLFGGPAAAALSAAICGAYRWHLGGAGAPVGVAVVFESAALGVALHYLRRRDERWASWPLLWAFGLLIHLFMLAQQLHLPDGKGLEAVRRVGPSVLLFYPLGFLVIAQVFLDGERRRKAESALASSRRKYKQLAESTEAILWEYDIQRDRWVYVAPQSERILGYEPEEWTDRQFWIERLHPDDREAALRDCAECELRGESRVLEYRFVRKDGRVVWLRDAANCILRQGRPAGLRGFMADITTRKQAEERIRESEERYRSLFENSHAAMMLIDPKSGAIVDANPGACAYYGWTREQLLSMRIGDINTLSPAEIQTEMSRAAAAQRNHFLFRHRRADGGVRDVEVFSGPISIEGRSLLYSIVHDISERKKAEEALRKSEEFQRAVIACSPIALFSIDPEGRVMSWNASAERILGWSAEEVVGKPLPIVPAANSAEFNEIREKSLRGEILANLDVVRMKKDGAVFHASLSTAPIRDSQGVVIGVMAALMDVTDRKRAEEASRQSEEFQRAIVDCSPVALYCYDPHDPEARVISWNASAERIYGWTAEEVLGKPLPVVPEEQKARFKEIRSLALQGRILTNQEVVRQKKDGSRFDASLSTALIRGAGGEPIGVMAAVMDITERKRAEQALRESEAFNRLVMDNIPIGLAVNSVDPNVNFNYMNEHFPRIYRTAREKLQESDAFFDVVYENPEFRAAIKKRVLEDCASGDPDRMRWDDIPIERAGEETTYISARNVMIPASGLMISAVWDVTDRKRAEEALARSEQRHRTLFESAPDAIFIQTDGRFAYLNAACAHLFGAESAAEMLGRPVLDWFHGKYRESVRQRIRTLNEERRQVPLAEEAIMTLKGETVPVEVAAVPFETDGKNGALVFMRDIRYRKQAEAERERLLSAIEQAEEIVVIAAADATIQYVNPAFERISGFSRAEAVGQTPRILKSGKHDNAYYAQMWRTLTSGQTWRGRFVNKRKDGALFTEEATISPVRDANGQIVNYVAVKRDVTRELELEQQLRQAQRMEAVGRLAGGVAHDFNNMLSVILGHADMALETIPETDPLREDILEIQKAGDRSAALVRQLLAFARKQTIAPKRLDLNDTIGGMLKMLSRLIGEDIDLLWKPSMDLWPVKMDPTQIDQILANLVVNSRDAIAEVGKISIETANVQFDEEYCARHAGFVPGCYVMLAVSDDGSGMEKEMLTSIFDPFFTTKPHGKGTGLGLATVYGIVKQNEGFINVYSEPGKGTTFRIYFPRLREENFTPEETLPQAGVRSGTETVLLVEDEKQLLRFATRLLQDLGYTVLASDTPREALRLAREYPGQIDLLISDVVMPEMSGRDMWNELLAVRPGLKCLFMSGYTANAIAHRGVLDEGVHFLQKPFTRQALASKVRETLEA